MKLMEDLGNPMAKTKTKNKTKQNKNQGSDITYNGWKGKTPPKITRHKA